MLRSRIDHVAITAPSLAVGVDYVRRTLGVTPQPGGEHPGMGTHNALLRLGDALYLEVIAPNPKAPPLERARWFELDRLDPDAAPRLATWVARTDDIRAAVAALAEPMGDIEPMSRGHLQWLITIPADGSLPAQGIAPTLIQWLTGPHPASALRDQGVSLLRLEGFHPDAQRITAMLESIGFEGEFPVSPIESRMRPCLVAHLQTPVGVRQLRSP
jgi:hypothetical protein